MLTFTTDLLAHTTLPHSLSYLTYAWSHCSDMLTLTSLTMWLRWEHAGSGGMLTLTSDNLASLVAVECSLSPLTIWLRWEAAVSGGSGFAGSKLVAVECSLSPL